MGKPVAPSELTPVADPPDGIEFTVSSDDQASGARSIWTLRAGGDLASAGSGIFTEQRVFASLEITDLPDDTELVGYAFTQFAMPVFGRPDRPFDFNPAPNLHSPNAVIPLLVRAPDGQVTLLAPLDSWHEQIITVRQDGERIEGLRWGWHGDLQNVSAGFETNLGVFVGRSAGEVFGAWGRAVLAGAATTRPDRAANPFTSRLSYWTDNGAAYWYRTEPAMSLVETLAAKKRELDDLGVVVGAWELDSWFYEHEISRPVTEVGYLEDVPPTGMMTWQPRADVLPDGIEALVEAIGGVPLGLHARHISNESPYLSEGQWWSDLCAHPQDQTFFDRWFLDAAAWGTSAIEQDWMLLYWFGVRQLREVPGRALAWQQALDRAAGEHDIGLIWCMATPGDLMATVELDNVIAVRTSDDYRFAADPALLWRWYLTVNRFVDAIDLATFKDCFFTMSSAGDASAAEDHAAIDGDPHREIEALLSAFSAGIAGIGDRLGRTDVAVIERLCEPDGRLVQPDRPLCLADQSFFDAPDAATVSWAHTTTTADDSTWHYVVALHAAPTSDQLAGSFELDADGEWLVYDWRNGTMTPSREVDVTLAHREWALFVFCPIDRRSDGLPRAVIGDVRRYATMGHARFEPIDGEDDRPITRWTGTD